MTLTSGQLDEIAKGVRRLVARNPGFMTGPGTNTYLVGTQQCAVIDPGPHDLVHIERIVEAVGSRLTAILATHTHPDHSPAVATLAHFTGAEVLGRAAPEHGRQDATFAPTHTLNDGDVVRIGELRLRAYTYDRESANFSRDALDNLLSTLDASPAVGEVYLLAHSMGNWIALEALRTRAIRAPAVASKRSKLKNVMLVAPDVDVDVFRSQLNRMSGARPPILPKRCSTSRHFRFDWKIQDRRNSPTCHWNWPAGNRWKVATRAISR